MSGVLQGSAILLFGVLALYWLIRGLQTGTMYCFVSLVLNGEASRKSNAAWFWTYAGFNLLLVVSAVAWIWLALRL